MQTMRMHMRTGRELSLTAEIKEVSNALRRASFNVTTLVNELDASLMRNQPDDACDAMNPGRAEARNDLTQEHKQVQKLQCDLRNMLETLEAI